MVKIGIRQSKKAHLRNMELNHIIEEFARCMYTAHLPYVAASLGRMTPGMEAAWNRYVVYAIKYAEEYK